MRAVSLDEAASGVKSSGLFVGLGAIVCVATWRVTRSPTGEFLLLLF